MTRSPTLHWHLQVESGGEHTLFRVVAEIGPYSVLDQYFQPDDLDESEGYVQVFSDEGEAGPIVLRMTASFSKPGEKAGHKISLPDLEIDVPDEAEMHVFCTIHRDLRLVTRVFQAASEKAVTEAGSVGEELEARLDASDWAEVERIATRVIALDPMAEGAYFTRAQARAELGRIEDALGDVETELALAPDDPVLLYWRGSLLSQLGRHDEGREDAEIAATLAPDDADCFCTLGEIAYRAGDIDAALEYLGQAIELDYADESSDGELLGYLRASKLFEAHRGDPRFKILFAVK